MAVYITRHIIMILKMLFITVDVVNEISSGGEAAAPI